MSSEALFWAVSFDRKVRGVVEHPSFLSMSAKMVLIYLADHHSEENGCFPSVATLAQETRQCVRAVNNALTELIQRGFVRRIVGGGRNGGGAYCSNEYELAIGAYLPPEAVEAFTKAASAKKIRKDNPAPHAEMNGGSNPAPHAELDELALHAMSSNPAPHAVSPAPRAHGNPAPHAEERPILETPIEPLKETIMSAATQPCLSDATPLDDDDTEAEARGLEGEAVSVEEEALDATPVKSDGETPMNGQKTEVKLADGVAWNELNVVRIQGRASSRPGAPIPRPGEPGYEEFARRHGGLLR